MNINFKEIKRIFGFEPALPASYQEDIISIWRERIFLIIFISTAVIATFTYIITVADTIQKGWWVNFAVYTLGYIAILCIISFRRIPFKIRAWTGSLIFYTFGVFSLMAFGMVGSGRVYLFAFSIVASLLLKMKGGVIALILNIIAIITVGWLAGAGYLGMVAKIPYTTELWFNYAITFIWLNAIITISLAMLVQALEQSLTKEKQFVGELDAINIELKKDINTRKKIEEAQRESEEKHRTLFESSRDAIMTIAPPTWLFTSGNPATMELFGMKDEAEFISLGPWQLSPERQPDNNPSDEMAMEMIETAMRNGSHFFEWTHCRFDGTPFPAEVLLTRMEQRGKVLIQATVRDITERKQVEEDLRESEIRYRSLVEHLPAITYTAALDESSTTLYVSSQIEKILGISPEEYKKDSDFWLKHIYNEDRERVLEEVSRAHETGQPFISEYRMTSIDGRIVWLRDEAMIIKDDKGRPLYLQGLMFDITERKEADEALRESEERFRAIFDSINDAVFIHDIETGAILDVNNRTLEMYGYSRKEISQLDVQAISLGEAPYSQQDALGWMKKAAMGGPQVFEWMAKHKSGRIFWVEVSMRSAVVGKHKRLLVVVRDITGRKQAEEEIHKLNLELEQRVQERTAELDKKNEELERMNKVFVGRELRMIELKKQIAELEKDVEPDKKSGDKTT